MSRPEFPEMPFGFPHAGGRSMPGVLSEARRLEAVEALARAAMNGSGGGGLPPGGATGELLAKASATDGDVEWIELQQTRRAIGTFTFPTTTGNFNAITGLGFNPKMLRFNAMPGGENTAVQASLGIGMALIDGSSITQRAMATFVSSTQRAQGRTADRCIVSVTGSTGNFNREGSLVSVSGGTVVINANNVAGTGMIVFWEAEG